MERQVSIEVRDVSKSFEIAAPRGSLVQRLRGRGAPRSRTLEVLTGISFEVGQGEFFGIVGRNGSGKSTLLKLLASVYKADGGRIRVAGRLAPFLELGVGFDPQLPARENVVLNGVMMGLTPQESERRSDAVIDFAGLRDFTDLQLKNYSSGMKVRLAFAALTEVDADILLLDEVLAVGDAEFQDKCETTFKRMRDQGRTIVLVTHSMATVNAQCDRAMVIDDGVIDAIGEPLEVSNRYLELNLRAAAEANEDEEVVGFAARYADVLADPLVVITDAWMLGDHTERGLEVPEREPIEVRMLAEVLRPITRPGFRLRIDDERGKAMFHGGSTDLDPGREVAEPGDRLEVSITIENRLAAGKYVFAGGLTQQQANGSPEPVSPVSSLTFSVAGDENYGVLSVEHEVSIRRLAGDTASHTNPG